MTAQPDFFSTQVVEARRFYLNLTPKSTKGVTGVCGGCEKCQLKYQINRQSFQYHGLEFVAKGEGELTLAGRHYPLRPGMVFAYGPSRRRNSSSRLDGRRAGVAPLPKRRNGVAVGWRTG